MDLKLPDWQENQDRESSSGAEPGPSSPKLELSVSWENQDREASSGVESGTSGVWNFRFKTGTSGVLDFFGLGFEIRILVLD